MIIDLLNIDDWLGVSENVEIAKGKYEIPTTWNKGKQQIKRKWHELKHLN